MKGDICGVSRMTNAPKNLSVFPRIRFVFSLFRPTLPSLFAAQGTIDWRKNRQNFQERSKGRGRCISCPSARRLELPLHFRVFLCMLIDTNLKYPRHRMVDIKVTSDFCANVILLAFIEASFGIFKVVTSFAVYLNHNVIRDNGSSD